MLGPNDLFFLQYKPADIKDKAVIVAADGLVHIYWGEEHIRSFTIDPTSRYQGARVR